LAQHPNYRRPKPEIASYGAAPKLKRLSLSACAPEQAVTVIIFFQLNELFLLLQKKFFPELSY
jgi:hypothetical protein